MDQFHSLHGGDLITVDKTGAAVADIFFKDGFYIFDLPGVRQIAGNVRPGNDGTGIAAVDLLRAEGKAGFPQSVDDF